MVIVAVYEGFPWVARKVATTVVWAYCRLGLR